MKQRLSPWWSATLALGCVIWVLALTGCGGGAESVPAGAPPVEEAPSAEYLKGEKAIQ